METNTLYSFVILQENVDFSENIWIYLSIKINTSDHNIKLNHFVDIQGRAEIKFPDESLIFLCSKLLRLENVHIHWKFVLLHPND